MTTQHIETLIVGAGQAGLVAGYHLAVVVSQSQNELRMLEALGLDIRPHRELMGEVTPTSADPGHIRACGS